MQAAQPIDRLAEMHLLRLKRDEVIRVSRKDPDVFVNYSMAWNAPMSGPNAWYPPRFQAVVDNKVVAMTCQMHRDWQQAITDHPFVYLEAPREHAKTQRVSIGRAIWEIGKNPDVRIKLVGQNDEKATEIVTAVGIHILNNPRVHAVFPDLRPDQYGQWAKHKIFVLRKTIGKDATLEGSGILATGVGGRADILIFDDPVDFKNAIQNPGLRKTVKAAYKDVWLNLLPSRGGRVIYICTPWHLDDLSNEVKKNKRYFPASFPIPKDLTPRWAEKWDRGALQDRKEEIGTRAFGRGFHLEVLTDEDQIFPMKLFVQAADWTLKLGDLPSSTGKWKFWTGMDLGVGRKSATRSSIFTFAESKGRKVPVEIKFGRWGETEKLKQLNETYRRWNSELLGVENNSYQETTINLAAEMDLKLPIKGIYTGAQKVDLDVGLPSLQVELENNIWLIPAKGHENVFFKNGQCDCPLCQWINECTGYPVGLSDIMMSWWIAREGARTLHMGKKYIRTIGGGSTGQHRRKSNGFSADLDEEDDD